MIDNHVSSLLTDCSAFSELKSFILSYSFDALERIVIADRSMQHVKCFRLKGLNELKTIVIGQSCFKELTVSILFWDMDRVDGVFQIVDCPKLQSITIGSDSFSDYGSFEVDHLPSLQSIQIGDSCFVHAPVFSLSGPVPFLP